MSPNRAKYVIAAENPYERAHKQIYVVSTVVSPPQVALRTFKIFLCNLFPKVWEQHKNRLVSCGKGGMFTCLLIFFGKI